MRIDNATEFSRAVVRDVLLFVAPPGVSGYHARVGNCARGIMKGRAYWDGCSFHDDPDVPFVTLYVGPAKLFPYYGTSSAGRRRPTGRGYLATPSIANRLEALVYISAHELRHLWQARVPRGRRVWGARGQFSERDGDAYAIRMLRKWRREHQTTDTAGRPLANATSIR